MFATVVGIALMLVTLGESFEAMVLPRRVTRRWRLTRFYYRFSWWLWRGACGVFPAGRNRENALSVFGPLSLLGLFVVWVTALIIGFALVCWGRHTIGGELGDDFRQCLYHSGETFFTLGYGDVTPIHFEGKLLSVVEAGTGFGFMALIISYLPVLYQAFSSRERQIGLLDARAGSPPTVAELLRRSKDPDQCHEIERFLIEWEAWAAELLESHLSFPVLGFYRSQHDNQSWLAALALVLDASAVQVVTGSPRRRRIAELTFAIARHTCVDLCLVFWLPPVEPSPERLTLQELDALFRHPQTPNELSREPAERLRELRELYEPFLQSLSDYFCFRLPRFFPDRKAPDNWQTTPWTPRPGITELPTRPLRADEHFG